jgi:hypothetical protein
MLGVPLEDPRKLVRLWGHEALRVFHDRLVSEASHDTPCLLVLLPYQPALPPVLHNAFLALFIPDPELSPKCGSCPLPPARPGCSQVSDQDRQWFQALLRDVVNKHMGIKFEKVHCI